MEKARRTDLLFPLRRMALQFRLMALRFCPMALLNIVIVYLVVLVIDHDIAKPEEKIEEKIESIFKQTDFPLAFPHP